MSRTQARQDSDTPYQDGHIFIPVLTSHITTGSGAVPTAPSAGLFGTSLPTTATAYVATVPVSSAIFRYGVQDDFQEVFGSGQIAGGAQANAVGSPFTYSTSSIVAGSNVSVPVLSSVGYTVGQWCTIDTVASGVQEIQYINAIPDGTHIQFQTIKSSHTTPFPISQNVFTTPAGVTGRPPFTGTTEFTSVTAPRPKGLLFKAIYPVYTIGAVNASLNTIGFFSNTFVNNAAVPTPTAIITAAANGLGVTFGANIQITPIPVPVAGQIFRTSRFTQYSFSWAFTTGSGGTGVLYGIYIDCAFSYL